MDSKINIYYFPLNFRGAYVRAMLSAVKANFTNNLITFDEWPAIKEKGEIKTLPYLEANGKKITQSFAILEYIATAFKVGYDCPEGTQKTWAAMMTLENLIDSSKGIYFSKTEEAKEEAKKKFIETAASIYSSLEKQASEHKGKYLIGDKFTIADAVFATFTANDTSMVIPDVLDKYPSLKKIFGNLKDNEFKTYFSEYVIQGQP